jgi:hypothetical protein
VGEAEAEKGEGKPVFLAGALGLGFGALLHPAGGESVELVDGSREPRAAEEAHQREWTVG